MKRKSLISMLILLMFNYGWNQVPAGWINEFHYDNVSTDAGEFVEVVVLGPQYQRPAWTLLLYNGGTGTPYGTLTGLSQAVEGDSINGMRFFIFHLPVNGIQNGSPDGFALCYTDSNSITHVIDLISYEGSFTALSGPALGMLLPDIGQSESNSTTPAGFSLQLNGDSKQSTWLPPAAETPGHPNFNPALPVVFLNFQFSNRNEPPALLWTTAVQINCSHFNIQVSGNGLEFTGIGTIPGLGNSSVPSDYLFEIPVHHSEKYARIEAVDYDGQSTFSSMIDMKASEEGLPYQLSTFGNQIYISAQSELLACVYTLDGRLLACEKTGDYAILQVPCPGAYLLLLKGEFLFERIKLIIR